MSTHVSAFVSKSNLDRESQELATIAQGVIVASGLEAAGEAIREGLKSIACSNKEIAKAIKIAGKCNAKAILKTGHLIESGLQSIADEMRRKTYMEEHYLLLDRIDSLEDKIIAKGGNLQEIYDNMQTKYFAPIALSISEILTLDRCLKEKELEWLKMVARTYKVNPWDVFVNILENCSKGYYCLNYDYNVAFYSGAGMIDGDSSMSEDPFGGYLVIKEDWYTSSFRIYYTKGNWNVDDNNLKNKYGCYDHHFVECKDDKIKDMVMTAKKMYDDAKGLSTRQLKYVNEFNAWINSINVEIMLENFRLLHTELREVYRQMKCK